MTMNRSLFVALDFETNGLNAYFDSILEVGAVKFSLDDEHVETFETLVCSDKGVGRTDIHGITNEMIRDAPTFSEILPHLVDFLNGTILVIHNAQFDLPFLRNELERLDLDHPSVDAICTLGLARKEATLRSRRLADCCIGLGVPVLDGHRALNDAIMASGVFKALAHRLPHRLPDAVAIALPIAAYAVKQELLPRPITSTPNHRPEWSLGSRIASLPAITNEDGPSVSSVTTYVSLLREVLADRVLTQDEVESLFDLADSLCLSRSEVRTIHAAFVSEVCEAALSDGVVSQQERREIAELGSVLEVSGWEEMLDQKAERLRSEGRRVISVWDESVGFSSATTRSSDRHKSWEREASINQSEDLSTLLLGRSIVITGEFTEFSREDGRNAILRRGGKSPGSVSRKTFAVVVGDSAGPSKIERCVEYGIPMLSYENFCDLLDTGRLPSAFGL